MFIRPRILGNKLFNTHNTERDWKALCFLLRFAYFPPCACMFCLYLPVNKMLFCFKVYKKLVRAVNKEYLIVSTPHICIHVMCLRADLVIHRMLLGRRSSPSAALISARWTACHFQYLLLWLYKTTGSFVNQIREYLLRNLGCIPNANKDLPTCLPPSFLKYTQPFCRFHTYIYAYKFVNLKSFPKPLAL